MERSNGELQILLSEHIVLTGSSQLAFSIFYSDVLTLFKYYSERRSIALVT